MSAFERRADSVLDPISFLRRVHPFDELPEAAFAAAAARIRIEFFEKGARILSTEGEPSRFLFVIRKGAVRLEREGEPVLALEERETFGYPSMLAGSPSVDVIAEEDVLLYLLPEDAFRELLREEGPFASFFTMALAHRLERARQTGLPQAVDFHAPVQGLVARAPIIVPANASIREAAEVMRSAGVSSVLVEGIPRGIMTDRDFRNRVLAEGRGPETPVREVASFPLYSLPPETPVYDAWMAMLDRGIKHLAIETEGRIVGVITGTDLMRHHTHGPLLAFKRIARLPDRSALEGYAADLGRLVRVLLASGLEATRIAQLVSRVNDALVHRILGWAEADLGGAPQSYAWVVFGSEGRLEQTLLTDQDNALVWEREAAADRPYFERLAARVIEDLVSAGFPKCAGGFMATNWRGPFEEWRDRFSAWIMTPRAEALLNASIFFDLRRVAGTLEFHPALTLLRHLKEEKGGIDLKRGGLMPIVGLARAYGLAAGSRATRTVARLEAAAGTGLIGPEDAETLSEAYRFLMQLRLKEQLASLQKGDAPGNRVRLASLSGPDSRHLKEVFSAVRKAQAAAALHFHTAELG